MIGFHGAFPLLARCASEFLASFTFVYLGEAVLANSTLVKTKGHGIGFAWVCFGFGSGLFVALQSFGRVSAHISPGMCLALYLLGELSLWDMLALSMFEILGGFVAGVMVLALYWPHFATVPPPPDALHLDKAEQGLGTSVAVGQRQVNHSGIVGKLPRTVSIFIGGQSINSAQAQLQAPLLYQPPSSDPTRSDAPTLIDITDGSGERQETEAEARYREAVKADQIAKLTVFATRPQIHHPVANFVSEFIASTTLMTFVLLIGENANALSVASPALAPLYKTGMNSHLASVMAIVVFMGTGGIRGFSGNPARDLGPRLAHQLMPIPGKGSSEWGNAWATSLAPMFGGVAAAFLFKSIQLMYV